MKTLFILFFLLGLTLYAANDQAYDSKVSDNRCTHWGHAEIDAPWIEKTPLQSLKGKITNGIAGLDGVLVEVYPLTNKPPHNVPCNQRIAACITNKTGRYSFILPSGQYELRASKHEWLTACISVIIDKEKGKKRDYDIWLHLDS